MCAVKEVGVWDGRAPQPLHARCFEVIGVTLFINWAAKGARANEESLLVSSVTPRIGLLTRLLLERSIGREGATFNFDG